MYVCGNESENGNNFLGKYWKNGVPVMLSDAIITLLFSIVVSGDDVYVAGYWMKGSVPVSAYWKTEPGWI
jgi:hypothetical protein